MSSATRSLPPGVEDSGDDIIFGYMWITVGTLKLIRTSSANYSVKCQFWGEPSPAILQTRTDLSHNQQYRTQKYDIKCPAPYFADYLNQMKKKFRMEVPEVGTVNFDITQLLKKNIQINSRQIFDQTKGFFQVIGKGNRKAGMLQIQIGCVFDPQIAQEAMGQSATSQKKYGKVENCPCQKMSIQGCEGRCICHRNPPKVKQNKILFEQDDKRIPNSLDLTQKPSEQFNIDKYTMKQEPIKQQTMLKKIDKKVNEEKIKESDDFPQVPKILTYSNLRLDYDEQKEQKQRQMENSAKQESYQEQRDIIRQIPEQQTKRQDKIEKKRQDKIAQSVEDSNFQILKKPQLSKEELEKQFYGAAHSPNKKIQIISTPQAKSTEYKKLNIGYQDQKNELSRVINLDEQLQRTDLNAPPLLKFEETQNNMAMKITGQRKKNKSNLILNLLVEIQTKSIDNGSKNLFTVVYRPYGKKDRVVLGPEFGDIITILCPVGQHEVKKMDKVPLILQFWDAVTNKFLGIIKLNLTKIKKGFILNNHLNEIGIKTNLLPTTITRGRVSIVDISESAIGSVQIYAAIGTSTQLSTHLNQPNNRFNETRQMKNIDQKPTHDKSPLKTKINDPQKQVFLSKNIELSPNQLVGCFDKLLNNLDQHSDELIDKLIELIKQQYIGLNEFNELCKFMGMQNGWAIFEILSKVEDKNGKIKFANLSQCFDDFKDISHKILTDLKTQESKLRKKVKNMNDVLKQIKSNATFRVISQSKLLQILSFHAGEQVAKNYVHRFTHHINVDQLQSMLLQRKHQKINISHFSTSYVNQLIANQTLNKLRKSDPDVMLDALKHNIQVSLGSMYEWTAKCGIQCSIWSIIHLFQHIKKQFELDEQMSPTSTALVCLYNWWVKENKKQNEKDQPSEQVRENEDNLIQSEKRKEQSCQQPKDWVQKQQNENIDKSNIIQKQSQEKPITQQKNDKKSNEGISKQDIQNAHNSSLNQKNQPPIYRHLFSIQPIQINLEGPMKGNCVVSYHFPYQQEPVKSKNFQTYNDKHKYAIKMYGTHGFSIQEPAENYLGDNVVLFYVKIDNRIEYEGALHVDQLLITPNTQQLKVIPLFSDRIEGMGGKIKVSIQYEMGLNSEHTLGKETTYQLYLPKTGYINYDFSSQVDITKVRSQLNLKQQFYVALVFDIFHGAPNLKSMFPPISSKLYADFSAPLQLTGALKLTLSSAVLQYFKSKQAKLSLNIIYYSKQKGNFQRKEVAYATIQLPLINIIKSEGIKGDYAFKNKLGMFVTISHANLKYQKQAKAKSSQNKGQLDKYKQSFWMLLHFLEFLNFQTEPLSWVRFQFVLRGKKYATEKIQLQPASVNPLNGSPNILLKMSESEFIDTKVLPITIYNNTSQKLAIDINLKAFGKNLSNQKCGVKNQMFVVVNQSSRPLKMRVSLKMMGFRGGPPISNLITNLQNNLQFDIFQEMDYPDEVADYDKIMSLFKNRLRITSNKMQQILSQILVNKRRDKLPFDMFTNRTHYKLDFTPIIAQNQTDVDYICQDLNSQISASELSEYLKSNGIKLMNFREPFLSRYTFRELNKNKLDKNVEFLGIQDQVDLITFLRKLKIADEPQNANSFHDASLMAGDLEFIILEGADFHNLYNGIKPNAIVRIPDLGLQTQISHRTSNPAFNQTFMEEIDSAIMEQLKNLKVEVYHCSIDDDDAQNILIGQGILHIPLHQLRRGGKMMKALITSTMSSRKKAYLNVKVGIGEFHKKRDPSILEQSKRQWQSGEASRIGQILHDIKTEMAYKKNLFESSDEEY